MFQVFVKIGGKEVPRGSVSMKRTDPNGMRFATEATPASAEKPKPIVRGRPQITMPPGVLMNDAQRNALRRRGHRIEFG